MVFQKGIAPLVVILLIVLGLLGGTTAGYEFREPIKKMIKGQTTADEIKEAVSSETAKLEAGKSKFELEGVATSVDVTNKILTVKIKSSTSSIKEMRLSETPIAVLDTVQITNGSNTKATISDIPINSKVHVGGTIKEGKLTATTVIIQKESALEKAGDNFVIGGTVKEVGDNKLVVTVKTANAKVKDQKGTDATIVATVGTVIQKGETNIALSEIKVGDEVKIEGYLADILTANKIEVKVKEQATELKETETSTKAIESNNSNSNGNGRATN